MKKLILAICMSISVIPLFAQSKSVASLYQKYKSHQDFFHLDLGGNFMNLAKSFNVKFDEVQGESISQSIEKIIMYKLPVTGEAAGSEYLSLRKGLEKERFDVMMEAGKSKSGVILYGKGGSRIQDLVLLVRDDKEELMVFEITGDFDPKMISDFGK
ncbi:DUF4252 domain-containing protein [Lunatibacter salilacus]|uniref:DUF4252 domain-containing protein n=1 Tax=Lunatibacter salilacus TaxID=2483804 RepID=UPI00131C98B2|nr:DUF4252 domain-containing protein [Lunatibacter salilacus]